MGHTIQTQAHKRGDYGRQAEARPREGGRTIQHRHTCGEKKRQGEARPREGGHTTQAHMWGTHAGRQWEKRGDKGGQDLGRQIRRETRLQKRGHTIQQRGNTETASNTGTQGGARLRKGGRIIRHRHTWGDMGDKLGDQARQELGNVDAPSNTGSPQKGEPTIHRHACGETMRAMGDNESNGRHWDTVGDKGRYIYGETMGRQDLGKVNTPSNASSRVPQYGGKKGKQGETSGHTIQHRHTYVGRQWETMGDKTSGRRTQHLTQAHMWETMEHKRREGETRPREGGHTIQHPAYM